MSDRRPPRGRGHLATVLGVIITVWMVCAALTFGWIWQRRNTQSTDLNAHRVYASRWGRAINVVYDTLLETTLEVDCTIAPLEPGKPVLLICNHPPIPLYTQLLKGIAENITPNPDDMQSGEWSVFVVMKSLAAGNPLAPAMEMVDIGLVVERGTLKQRKASVRTVEENIARLVNKQVIIILFADEHRFTTQHRDDCREWVIERYPDEIGWVNNVLTPRISGIQAIRRAIPGIRVIDATMACTRRCDTIMQVEPLCGATARMRIRDVHLRDSDEDVREDVFHLWAAKDRLVGDAFVNRNECHTPLQLNLNRGVTHG